MANKNIADLFNGFSKLNRNERLHRLVEMGALSKDDLNFLTGSKSISTTYAENFIENVIGYFAVPLGVATNFNIDGRDIVIPMAVEETSIIAAASKTAKWIRQSGSITTSVEGQSIIGQIQIAKVNNFAKLKSLIETNKEKLIHDANTMAAANLLKRGGGVTDIEVRHLKRPDNLDMAVIHVMLNPCDAMGANMITQICEYLKMPIEQLSGETVTMCILSNLNDRKLTKAKVIIQNIDPELGEKIAEASIFAETDPYRAATNNKGVLNGMDPILIATGNDWRALEAGVHAYATRDGQYRSITQWQLQGKDLVGTLTAPIIVGIVGGVTNNHPTAKMCLNMMKINTANELARIVAAVGLVQNLGAINALVTFGFIEGHMKLHISNLTLSAGAKEKEIPLLEMRLREILKLRKRITLSNVMEILNEIRSTKKASFETGV